jgi:glycosyltransferase involved in cell wall biosynthesis
MIGNMIDTRKTPPVFSREPQASVCRPPIRVGFVLHGMQVAGAEMLVWQIIRGLKETIQPTIFCLDQSGELAAQLAHENCQLITLARRPGRDFRAAWRLASHLRRLKIEVVHAHQYSPFFYAALARLVPFHRFKIIFTEHGRHFPDIVSPLRRTANRWFLNHLADAVSAVSDFSAASLAEKDGFHGPSIVVIENGVDIQRFNGPASLRNLDLDRGRRYLVCVARFHPVKDHATLLRAFAIVARQRSDVDLLLVGDGPLRGDLEKLARELGIEERVRFVGLRHDVPGLLRAAEIFVLTSLSEAAPLTVLEAMASRLPVVVTAVGGNPEIVRDGVDGYLAPRGDAPAIASAILSLLDDPKAAGALGAAGAARVRERYSLERTIERYFALYARLAGHA